MCTAPEFVCLFVRSGFGAANEAHFHCAQQGKTGRTNNHTVKRVDSQASNPEFWTIINDTKSVCVNRALKIERFQRFEVLMCVSVCVSVCLCLNVRVCLSCVRMS
jgi:hypothetical protein